MLKANANAHLGLVFETSAHSGIYLPRMSDKYSKERGSPRLPKASRDEIYILFACSVSVTLTRKVRTHTQFYLTHTSSTVVHF